MWVVVFFLVGFWGLGLFNGYSFGGLIHILLVYAGLMVTARLLERHRRGTGQSTRAYGTIWTHATPCGTYSFEHLPSFQEIRAKLHAEPKPASGNLPGAKNPWVEDWANTVMPFLSTARFWGLP